MANKLGRMLTYLDGFQRKKSKKRKALAFTKTRLLDVNLKTKKKKYFENRL